MPPAALAAASAPHLGHPCDTVLGARSEARIRVSTWVMQRRVVMRTSTLAALASAVVLVVTACPAPGTGDPHGGGGIEGEGAGGEGEGAGGEGAGPAVLDASASTLSADPLTTQPAD